MIDAAAAGAHDPPCAARCWEREPRRAPPLLSPVSRAGAGTGRLLLPAVAECRATDSSTGQLFQLASDDAAVRPLRLAASTAGTDTRVSSA